jgi:hypothetical protein
MTRVTQIGQGAFDAMHALFDRHLRQADKERFGQSCGRIDLGLNRNGVDTDEREGVQFGEHERRIPELHCGEVRKSQAQPRLGRLYPMPRRIANDFERSLLFTFPVRWAAEQAADAHR